MGINRFLLIPIQAIQYAEAILWLHARCHHPPLASEYARRRKGLGISLPHSTRCGHLHSLLRSRTRFTADPLASDHPVISQPIAKASPVAAAPDAAGA